MSNETPRPASGDTSQLLIDLGPVVVFVIAYNVLQRVEATRDNAVYIATGIFIVTTLVAIAYCQWKRGRIPPVLIVTGVIVTAFGGLTIALHDENIIKIKPTAANLFYAAAIVGSVITRENVIKLLFKHIFTLPERIWTVLALRWAACFAGLAIVNEVMSGAPWLLALEDKLTNHSWRSPFLTTSAWVTWHFPVLMGLMVVFALANTPLLMKHQLDEQAPASSS